MWVQWGVWNEVGVMGQWRSGVWLSKVYGCQWGVGGSGWDEACV